MEKIPVYLGVDPGKTTGLAIVNDDGNIIYAGQKDFDGLFVFLKKVETLFIVRHIVMEDFIVYSRMKGKMTGDRVPAKEAIGMVNMWAKMNNVPVTMQMASVLSVAERQSEISKKGESHSATHWKDAANHVLYYMYRNNLCPTPLARRLKNEKEAKS